MKSHEDTRSAEFMSIASHELKNPITTIKAFTQLLEKYYAPDTTSQANHYLEKIDGQLTKLTSLIDDMLDVSKIQSGTLVVSKEIFELNQLIRQSIESLQKTTNLHTIRYTEKPALYVEADKHRIAQVMHHLLTNAITYSPQGGDIFVQLISQKNDVFISIKDTGIGVPETEFEAIFTQSYAQNRVPKSNFPGLGIGLFISAAIITKHGGKIRVESQGKKGATFSFTLPKRRTV